MVPPMSSVNEFGILVSCNGCQKWFDMWDSSGNSASIHERLQPVTSYLSMNGVDSVDSNGCQEQHVCICAFCKFWVF